MALSTTEAKYIAAMQAAKEALWIQMFLTEIAQPLLHPVTLYCDNQSVISVSKNDQFCVQTKHINIRYHFIQDVAECGLISIHPLLPHLGHASQHAHKGTTGATANTPLSLHQAAFSLRGSVARISLVSWNAHDSEKLYMCDIVM